METTRPAAANEVHSQVNFDEIVADFELLEDWEDRYRYVIELGRKLQPLPEAERNDINKVQGCVSQVWLATTVKPDVRAPRLSFIGDSDAHIVRGLIAILFALYSGKSADAILDIDANAVLSRLHLKEHLTPQRSNGLLAMVERIRKMRGRPSRTLPRFTDRQCLAMYRASAGSLASPMANALSTPACLVRPIEPVMSRKPVEREREDPAQAFEQPPHRCRLGLRPSGDPAHRRLWRIDSASIRQETARSRWSRR